MIEKLGHTCYYAHACTHTSAHDVLFVYVYSVFVGICNVRKRNRIMRCARANAIEGRKRGRISSKFLALSGELARDAVVFAPLHCVCPCTSHDPVRYNHKHKHEQTNKKHHEHLYAYMRECSTVYGLTFLLYTPPRHYMSLIG